MTDFELLREFSQSRSEPAFAELVQRYAPLVHGSAFRQTHDPHLAEEVTQAVFILLSRKAPSLTPEVILSGWLFRATRFAAADLLKAERRRQFRETVAQRMNEMDRENAPPRDSEESWGKIAGVLDECVANLAEQDRHAILLRFFENKTLVDVGVALGTSAEAARKRVTRALEKLQVLLVRRGIATPAAGLGALLSVNAAPATPVTVAAKATAIAAGASSSNSAMAMGLAESVARSLAWLKLKPWIAAASVMVAGGATLAVKLPNGDRIGTAIFHPHRVVQDDYRPAGFDDPTVVHNFVRSLKASVDAGDASRISQMIRFPLRVNRSGQSWQIDSADQFIARFPELFSPTTVGVILKSPEGGLFCTPDGVMVGAGTVWVAPQNPGHSPKSARIIALNL